MLKYNSLYEKDLNFQILTSKSPMQTHEFLLIQNTCYFLECIYDPYLTWRSYLQRDKTDFTKINYNAIQLHAEIVPFIYCE